MEKYKDVVDAVLQLCEEVAKLTGNKWDDSVVSLVESFLEKFFSVPKIYGSALVGPESPEVKTMPAWLVPFILALLEALGKVKD